MKMTKRRQSGGAIRTAVLSLALSISLFLTYAATPSPQVLGNYTLVGWNNLGMHCMDADFQVFGILPPYNTVVAQLKNRSGALVTNPAGITVTYQGIADPDGSINVTAQGKTNFWDHLLSLFGVSLAPDVGLAGNNMPGPLNTPQLMTFEPASKWFVAYGIPITPYDDAGHKNYYPLVRLVAKDSSGAVLATTDVVLPVSDEMDCTSCHASGAGPAAKPAGGWVYDANKQKDFRLNIMRLHDERQLGNPVFQGALATNGFNGAGLYATATGGRAVLCAACHGSEALPGSGIAGIPPLTGAMHAGHSGVTDPTNGLSLESSANRSACYRCHPGSETRCLRGAMGNAVASDGSLAIQCQSCHGKMSAVGAATRTGWLDEPNCQACHTGTAVQNNGQIRYTSVFETSGVERVAVNQTYATNPDTPAPGKSLYRFSSGHGGLQCEACHGSTHAEYPSAHRNDNLQNIALQGHDGTLSECTTCHATVPTTSAGGPHGMHPVGQSWLNGHKDAASGGKHTACAVCHGTDYRGSVLSRALANRTINAFGTKNFWKGSQIGCYSCHRGPTDTGQNSNRAPVANNGSASTPGGTPVGVPLTATDADSNPLTFRVVGQPVHGTAGLSGTQATYYPEAGYTGPDSFTFAAWDGSTNSNVATVSLNVTGSGCTLNCSATAPTSADAGVPVQFSAGSALSNCAGSAAYEWDFGDGGKAFVASPQHVYGGGGTFAWTLKVTSGTAVCNKQGSVSIQSGGPAKVPSAVSPLKASTITQGASATVTWDAVNCASTGYHLVYGFGSGISAWNLAGGECGLGSTGSYPWLSPPDPSADSSRFLWFLVVGDDGATTEGSWGLTSSGQERGGSAASAQCGFSSKVLGGVCSLP